MSPILFFIYISGVFDAVKEKSPEIISLSFMDDLGFLANGNSIQEVAASLKKMVAFKCSHIQYCSNRVHIIFSGSKQKGQR